MATIGTPGADALAGTNVFGLGGNDTLSSTSLFGQLVGGEGSDQLTIATSQPTTSATRSSSLVLIGGGGNDDVDITSNVDNSGFASPVDFSAQRLIDGGAGDDTVTLAQSVYNVAGSYFQGGRTTSTTTVLDAGGDNLVSLTSNLGTVDADPIHTTIIAMGSGDDTVSINNSGEGYNYGATSDHSIGLGGGDDSLTIVENVAYSNSLVQAGNGDDTVDVTYNTDGANSAGVSLVLFQDAGAGNDSLTVTASGQMDGGAQMDAVFELGTGSDTLDISPGMHGDISVFAGTGNNSVSVDMTSLGLFYGTQSNVRVDALGGSDRVAIDGPGFGERPLYADVSTGFGNDTVLMTGVSSVDIDVGSNNDFVQVVTTGTTYGYSNFTNAVYGGQGNDTLTIVDNYAGTGAYTRLQTVAGGAGNDEIFSRVGGTSGLGSSDVDGGSGNDDITIRGGENNTVDGGFGKDTIDGSDAADVINGGGGNDVITGRGGDDLITGGAGADVYVFNQFVPFGDDTISDWNMAVDILDINLTDFGTPGLLDDLEAITTLVDLGSTVVLSFTGSGSSITFNDTTGTVVTSIGDLMNDPFAQII